MHWSWARDVNGRDRDETETLIIFLEMRPRRDVGRLRLETETSRPRPQPWKYCKCCNVQTTCNIYYFIYMPMVNLVILEQRHALSGRHISCVQYVAYL